MACSISISSSSTRDRGISSTTMYCIFDECTPVIHEFDLIARVLARLYQEQYYTMSESRDWTSIVSPSKQPLLANQLINQSINQLIASSRIKLHMQYSPLYQFRLLQQEHTWQHKSFQCLWLELEL